MNKIIALMFMLLFLATAAVAQDDIQMWTSLNFRISDSTKAFSYRHEMRYRERLCYLTLDHIDFKQKIRRWISVSVSLRGLYAKGEGTEWRPMLNLAVTANGISNRFRITYKTASEVVRFRNKITVNFGLLWAASEVFIENGETFQSRFYVGLSAGRTLKIKPFVLHQSTRGSDQWIYGIDILTRF